MDDEQNYNYDNNYDQQQYYEYSYDDYEMQPQQQENLIYSNYEDLNFVNKKQYEVIPYSSLFTELRKNIKNAQEITTLSEGWCLLLLRQFKWDVQSMAEYFHNMEKYQDKIGYNVNYKKIDEMRFDQKGNCEVCYTENVALLENICGHAFCVECWKGQLSYSLTSNQPFVKCMACSCPVLHEVILKFLTICYPEDRKLYDKYEKILCELFSAVHRNYQFCTGVDCNNCIKVNNLNLTTVRCTCGKSFCFKCKSDDHSPCSCEQRKSWLETVLKQQADAKWMSVNTKLCPWCKKAVERSAGCNFMSCICGKSFCYLCSRPWQPDHKDHFKCHIYKKSQNEQVNRQKQILQKMNFFTQRFLDNQKTAQQNKRVDIFEKRKYLFKTLKVDLSDSEFIDFSYRFSIECCETLKWINAYSYYKKWINEMQKQKFQFYQGEFEKYKVNLLKLLAVDLKNFFKSVENCEKKQQIDNQIIKDTLLQQFKTIKTSIVNYTTMTKKYKEKFLEEIQKMPQVQDNLMKKKSTEKPLTKNKPNQQQKQSHSKTITRSETKKQSMAGYFSRYFHN